MGALIIARKDYRSFFNSAVAYVITALFIFLMSWMFFQILSTYASRSFMMMMQGGGAPNMNLNEYVFAPHFGNVNVVLLIMIPALTMRLLSEEKKSRTMDLLMTSPITSTEIVVGKILAGCFLTWTILAFLSIYPLSTKLFAQFDKGPIITSFIGLALLSGVYVSMGVFASSLTENAIIAYFVAFVISLFFWVIGWASASMDGPVAQAVFNHLSIVSHFSDFAKGMINTSGIIYYLSLIVFFGFLTQRSLESSRWR
ncbi:MAG: ABC transporter permease subunit [Oligoflexia bacterium]|nr:ABC transporter permease subunit [Oligoflexia bacterium]